VGWCQGFSRIGALLARWSAAPSWPPPPNLSALHILRGAGLRAGLSLLAMAYFHAKAETGDLTSAVIDNPAVTVE